MSALIELRDIYKTYSTGDIEVQALRGVNATFLERDFVAIMGTSGSGKSTIMNIIGCLDRPSRGAYLLDGVDVSNLDRDALATIRNEKIGFVFQGFNLLPRTSAVENVELPLLYTRRLLRARERRDIAMQAIESVGLSDRASHYPNQLSGGQQQRVAIARAIVNQPELLLADEPTGNLDTGASLEIMHLFQELNRRGITIIIITHEPELARFARRNIALRDGSITRDALVRDRLDAGAEVREFRAHEVDAVRQ